MLPTCTAKDGDIREETLRLLSGGRYILRDGEFPAPNKNVSERQRQPTVVLPLAVYVLRLRLCGTALCSKMSYIPRTIYTWHPWLLLKNTRFRHTPTSFFICLILPRVKALYLEILNTHFLDRSIILYRTSDSIFLKNVNVGRGRLWALEPLWYEPTDRF